MLANLNKAFKGEIIKGALFLGAAMILAKVIGALYRIPLTNIVGAKNIGVYQMVFPLYTMLLTLSSSAIPVGLTKLIAEGKNPEKVLKISLIGFLSVAAVGTLAMCALSPLLSRLQGSKQVISCYLTLSPSVFFVAIISCFRGYFQGKGNMLPTAVSNVTEQAVKLIVGLVLCFLFVKKINNAAVLLTIAVTCSEIFTAFYFIVLHKIQKRKNIEPYSGQNLKFSAVFSVILPLMLSGLIMPLSRLFDSFVIAKWLPFSIEKNISDFGLYSGATESVIGVPVAIVSALIVASQPQITRKKDKQSCYRLLLVCLLLSFAFVAITVLSGGFLCKTLYSGLSLENKNTLVVLLKLSAVQILFLSILQAESIILTAHSKHKILPVNLAIGVAVKIASMILLVKKPVFGVFGLSISDSLCYFVACGLDLLYIISIYQGEVRFAKRTLPEKVKNSL